MNAPGEWPSENGRGFLKVCQALMRSKEQFLKISREMLIRSGILAANDSMDQYGKLDQWPLQGGYRGFASIFCFDMSASAFWKHPSASDMVPICKSIVLTKFKKDI